MTRVFRYAGQGHSCCCAWWHLEDLETPVLISQVREPQGHLPPAQVAQSSIHALTAAGFLLPLKLIFEYWVNFVVSLCLPGS